MGGKVRTTAAEAFDEMSRSDEAAPDIDVTSVTIEKSPHSERQADGKPSAVRFIKQRLMVADLTAVSVGAAAAFLLQRWFRPVPRFIWMDHLMLFVVSLPFFVVGAAWTRLYQARANERPAQEWRNIVNAVMMGMGGLVAVAFALQYKDLSRLWVVLLGSCVTLAMMVERNTARRVFTRMRADGRLSRRIVIVGTDAHAVGLLHTYQRRPDLGYEVVGFVGADDLGERGGVRVVGGFDDVLSVLPGLGAIGVVVSLSAVSSEVVNTLTRNLTDAGYHVALSSSLHDIDVTRVRPQQVDGRTFIYVEPTIRTGWRAYAKRIFDVTMASAILVVTAPIWLIAAALIKLDSPGPVIFSQDRVGLNGRVFRIMKLRTMSADAEALKAELAAQNEMDGPLFKMARDPRITRVGRFLRKLSIDELPQLVAVLHGTMSMVGPRPALPAEVAEWAPEVHDRLRVLPGITGMWQVSGRSGTTFEEYKRLDLYYVDNWSLTHDLRICVKTFGVVLRGSGAS